MRLVKWINIFFTKICYALLNFNKDMFRTEQNKTKTQEDLINKLETKIKQFPKILQTYKSGMAN